MASEHLVQYRHLRQHAVTGLMDYDAAWPVEDRLADNDATTNRKTVHESAVVACVVEPRLVNTPAIKPVSKLLIAKAIAVVAG